MVTTPAIDIRSSNSRAVTDTGWLHSQHSFNFGPHHLAANDGHGLLIVSNDDRVAAGGGFGTHGHRNMEIITWVLAGELAHQDSTGTNGVLYPGLAQRMSAGSGIRHSEMNASDTEPVHFVQMWVVPDTADVDPSYEQKDMNQQLAGAGLVPVASGRTKTDPAHADAIHIHQAGAAMHIGRLAANEAVLVPDARFVHIFVAHGAIEVGSPTDPHVVTVGDAVRYTDAGPVTVTAQQDTEIIVWESDSPAQR